ncbi:MAG: ribonucleotide-diphosphate reductase subunit beta, partial [Microbacteriaceae bacterium]
MTVIDNQPSQLNAELFKEIENAQLSDINNVDINDVINKYIYAQISEQPTYVEQYKRYLKQRWDVYDIDFSQDYIDWHENMSQPEKDSFLAIASGFHHGERQVEVELPVFMLGGSEDQKLFISSQIEDEARHTVFFDRFYHEAVGLEGDLMDVLDQSFEWVGETFIGPFGMLAYQADALLKDPDDIRLRVQYATNYMLWIEGVLAVSVMQITLRYARQRKVLPGYYAGFTLTARDEARHVQAGLRFLTDSIAEDPTL